MTKFSEIPEGGFFRFSESHDHCWTKIQPIYSETHRQVLNAITNKGTLLNFQPQDEVIYYPNAKVVEGEAR